MTEIARADSAVSATGADQGGGAGVSELQCECEVLRIGEIFVELGFAKTKADSIATQWELTVTDDALETVYQSTISTATHSKVVKLKQGRLYVFAIRLHSDVLHKWGPCSSGRFRMHPDVLTKCSAIGEDNVVFKWERPARQEESSFTPEKYPEMSAGVRAVEGYQLKVLNLKNEVEFHELFDLGVRAHTIYGLKPGTRYVVHASWHTLLGQPCKWQEVVRFETQSAFEIKMKDVGEDFLSIVWGRMPGPSTELPDSNFQKSTAQSLQFEVVIEGGGHNVLSDAVELHSSIREHKITGLLPSTQYSLKLRAMSTRARWGVYSSVLMQTTLSMLSARLCTIGENFSILRWGRLNKNDGEEDSSYRLNVLGVTTKYEYDEEFSIAQIRADGYKVCIEALKPGHAYKAFCRASRNGDWGLWSEGLAIQTQARPEISCTERGEDFVAVKWTNQGEKEQEEEVVPRPSQTYQLQVLTANGKAQDNPDFDTVVQEFEHSGESEGFRIPKLLPDTQYAIKVRVVQQLAVPENGHPTKTHHGLWSDHVIITTLLPIVLQLVDIGEDFLQLSWQRALKTSMDFPDKPGKYPNSKGSWYDLKYEVVLGCVDSGEDDVLHRELVDTSYRISQLTPNTTYSVAVRACDNKEQWGLWSTVYFRTLSSVVLKCHEVGEDFSRVVWEREAIGPASTRLSDVFGADSFVSQYRLLLYCVTDIDDNDLTDEQRNITCDTEIDEIYPPAKGSKFVIDKYLDPTNTSCRIPNLIADRTYAVVVRAASKTGIWGLWSDTVQFCTVAPFVIPVHDLSIGENYVHFLWGRNDNPVLEKGITKGDFHVTSQQLRIRGLDDNYSLDRILQPSSRDLKVYGLKPASAYSIRIRSCNTSGEWGTWSQDVLFQTRATIVMRTLEIAEDYIVVRWERKQSDDRDRGYPSGRGYITRYHLRVTGENDFNFDAELLESNSPYRVPNLLPDTKYRIVIKANYNDDEWGLWSRPLQCLTLKLIEVKTLLIGEEFANIKWARPEQSREVATETTTEEELPILCFGQHRPTYQLRVTTRDTAGPLINGNLTWQGLGVATASYDDATADDQQKEEGETKIVMETEVSDTCAEVPFTVANMKPDTYYTIVVRSRIDGGTWGVWSATQRLVTLKPCVIAFVVIGEDFARITWERPVQQVVDSRIAKGRGTITQSQVKVKTPTGQVQTYDINSAVTNLTVEDYRPATTYQVSVRTYNDNHDWGLWSPDKAFRTISGLHVDIESIGEDYIWMRFARETACTPEEPSVNTVVSVDTSVVTYQVRCVGENGFSYTREMAGDAKRCLSLRGLEPSVIHEIAVRGLSRYDAWGKWSGVHFQTLIRLSITFGNIGEQFVVVNWFRPNAETGTAGVQNIQFADPAVSRYRLRIQEVNNASTTRLYDLTQDCLTFKIPDLTPNSTYSVWVASCNEKGVWGLWSAERRVHTHPPLNLSIDDIGEAYANVAWARDTQHEQEALDFEEGADIHPLHIGRSIVKEYHVKVEGRQGVVVERHLEPDVQGCKVEGLEVDTLYQVMVRMKDAEGEWGLWSSMKRFITLRPVELTVHKVGESFVHLEWGRRKERKTDAIKAYVRENEGEEEEEEHEEDEEEEDEEDDDKTGVAKTETSIILEDDLEDVAVGSETVQRWLVRVCRGQGSEERPLDTSEFELAEEELSKRITDLDPCMTYTISVRALSSSGQWGFWSQVQTISTLPLIRTSVSYIGEDFIVVTWGRDKPLSSAHLGIFPPDNAVHNYQMKITPVLAKDGDETDRDFDVSQPKYEVWELLPGTRYRVGVREKDIEGNWGMWSEVSTVQTLDPIGAKILDLGECYCSIKWERCDRAHDQDEVGVILSEADTTQYQVSVDAIELRNSGNKVDNYHVVRSFKKGETEWSIPDLLPNRSYCVKVRCQTDGEYWGGWSESLAFATMKVLQVMVECINENNALVSWNREAADWLMATLLRTPQTLGRCRLLNTTMNLLKAPKPPNTLTSKQATTTSLNTNSASKASATIPTSNSNSPHTSSPTEQPASSQTASTPSPSAAKTPSPSGPPGARRSPS